ncbi:hypothetical protein Tco_1201136 [Tanacetum coccineum]
MMYGAKDRPATTSSKEAMTNKYKRRFIWLSSHYVFSSLGPARHRLKSDHRDGKDQSRVIPDLITIGKPYHEGVEAIPLHPFFLEVLQYYDVHNSRLNPFGLAELTTYIVMCKAYGFEPTLNAFRGVFNLGPAGDWITFFKRDNLVHAEYPALVDEANTGDRKSFKDP